jgi:hypothetical protein
MLFWNLKSVGFKLSCGIRISSDFLKWMIANELHKIESNSSSVMKNLHPFMEPKFELPCSQDPSNGPYTKPDEFRLYLQTLIL